MEGNAVKRIILDVLTLFATLIVFVLIIRQLEKEWLVLPIMILNGAALYFSYGENGEKMMKFFQKHITTPMSVYVIALGFGVILVVIDTILKHWEKQATWLSSVGTGMIASVFVAVLIDIGNTKRDRENNETVFKAICTPLLMKCDAFQYHVVVFSDAASHFLPITTLNLTLTERLIALHNSFPENGEAQQYVMNSRNAVSKEISHLSLEADKLVEKYDYYHANVFYTEEFRKKLIAISESTKVLYHLFTEHPLIVGGDDVQHASSVYINCVLAVFPELREKYTEKSD